MAGFPFDLVVFDLDGTLADTAPDLAAALNHVLVRLGRPPIPEDEVRRLIGHGARALLRSGLTAAGRDPIGVQRPGDPAIEELVEEGFPLFLEYYASNICAGTRAYPGLESALDALDRRGARLAICTNKSERLARQLVEALGWTGRFASIVGPDTVGARKPDPLPLREAIARGGGGRAAFVGDSAIDSETARAAGITFVAVSFGFSDRPAGELDADAVIHRYPELVGVLESL